MQEAILDLLKNKDMCINELAKALKCERHTVSKYLNALEGANLIKFKSIGKAKYYSLSDNPLIELLKSNDELSVQVKDILAMIPDHISIQDKDYNVVWNNKIENELGKKCYELYANRESACPNCPANDVYKTGSSKKEIVQRECRKEINIHPIKDKNDNVVAVVEIAR